MLVFNAQAVLKPFCKKYIIMRFSLVRAQVSQRLSIVNFVPGVLALFPLLWSGQGRCLAVPGQTARKGAPVSTVDQPKRFLLAHYMPWYASKTISGQWGWHWTMNHFDPDKAEGPQGAGQPTRPEGASRFRPLIGLYDSGDPDTLKCQVMLMKLAGIDGVIIDWYGTENFYDYATLNRNTLQLIPLLQQAGLRFAVCYEDQSVAQMVTGKRFAADEAVARGQRLMEWMQKNFFSNPAYLDVDGHPLLLSFGEPYYKDAQWNDLFSVLPTKPLYLTEHVIRAQTAASGGFDWPVPNGGLEGALKEQNDFYERAKGWPLFTAAAYPRFQDIYAQAGVHPSWGSIEDREGRTYSQTLTRALQSSASIVQLVTWNDWGEGTQIEPSVEFGYRDLEETQKLRRQYLDLKFSPTAADLRLPVEWYRLKKRAASKKASDRLDAFFHLVASGRINEARSLLPKTP